MSNQTPTISQPQPAQQQPSPPLASSPSQTTRSSINGPLLDKPNYADPERGWIFHRDRKQPTPNPSEPPINQIKFYLDRYNIKGALQIFFDENTLKLLSVESDFMWDIIQIICKRLRGLCQYRFRVFEGCEKMLCRIAIDENCNPKEVLVSLLAEMRQQDNNDDDNVFRAMIRPLEGTLLRMNHPSPRYENLSWVLNVLMRHISSIELPQEYNLEGKKRLALPNDPSVKRFIEILPLMLSFIDEFVEKPMDHFEKSPMPILTESQIEEVLNGELVDDDDLISDQNSNKSDYSDASVRTLLELMSRPITYLDLSIYCSDLRLFGNRCLSTLLKLRPNLFSPIYKRISQTYNIYSTLGHSYNPYNTTKDNKFANINPDGPDALSYETNIPLATCTYIYRCERAVSFDTVQCFPQIITHESMLFIHIPYIVSLLGKTEILVHEKGLFLLESLIKSIKPESLGPIFLEAFEMWSLHKQLFRIMVFSPLCTNRRKAYDVFTSLSDILTNDCKVLIFKDVLSQTDLRPCIRAACVDQYRKHLTNVYREGMNLHQQLTALAQTTKSTSEDNNKIIESTTTSSPIKLSEATEQIEIKLNGELCINNEINNKVVDSCDLVQDKLKNTTGPTMNLTIMERMKHLQSRYKALGGSILVEFLDLCIKACLPDLQHTDIIENYELLLATLTMFRFLKLRHTIFKDDIEEDYLSGKKLKKIFFDPIRNAISLIMNELKLHHKEIVDGHKSKNVKMNQYSLSYLTQSRNELDLLSRILGPSKLDDIIESKEIVVANEVDGPTQAANNNGKLASDNTTNNTTSSSASLDTLYSPTSGSGRAEQQQFNEQDEADCLNWALCRLDLVESVLVRTCDLYNC